MYNFQSIRARIQIFPTLRHPFLPCSKDANSVIFSVNQAQNKDVDMAHKDEVSHLERKEFYQRQIEARTPPMTEVDAFLLEVYQALLDAVNYLERPGRSEP